VTYAAYPDYVKSAPMEPQIAPNGPIRDALDYRHRFPDGRIGSDSSLATVADGEQIIAAAVKGLLDDVARFEAE
ncbi:MAG TPA: creatininase family protein, partial [Asticcacaulis sp.]